MIPARNRWPQDVLVVLFLVGGPLGIAFGVQTVGDAGIGNAVSGWLMIAGGVLMIVGGGLTLLGAVRRRRSR